MGVFALTSHKGGTGRSTATANIAYRIAKDGVDVCCVDLDLDSPTLGSIFGWADGAVGADRGVHNVLVDDASPRNSGLDPISRVPASAAASLLTDCWGILEDRLNITVDPGKSGKLQLLPGSRKLQGYALLGPEQMREALKELLESLASHFSIVLDDVRSGLSEITGHLMHAGDTSGKLDAWLVFLRWTPQHILGANDLYSVLRDGDQNVELIRTAVPSVNNLPGKRDKAWYRDQDIDLEKLMAARLPTEHRAFTIPHEPMLQWQERVITDSDASFNRAATETIDGYQRVADFLKER